MNAATQMHRTKLLRIQDFKLADWLRTCTDEWDNLFLLIDDMS
jgi:hypothetical protein